MDFKEFGDKGVNSLEPAQDRMMRRDLYNMAMTLRVSKEDIEPKRSALWKYLAMLA
jgi:hypothetical protein